MTLLRDEVERRPSAGAHFSEWARTHCRHTMQVPGGPPPGSPLVFEPWQDAFWDEALELKWDPAEGRWVYVYRTVLLVIPRKNSKTTQCSAFALYSGGPWEGEVRPSVLLAAGSKNQAGELWGHARAFIDDPQNGSAPLQAEFAVFQTGITSKSTGGSIQRVAGDGKLNHSRNPSKVIADELHVWTTPRQLENWRALTTAGGARIAPQVYGLTTAGDDPDGMLGQLQARVKDVCEAEYGPGVWREGPDGERLFSGLRIYRNRALGILMYEYAVAPGTPLEDTEAWKAANPASWRTPERIGQDLADPTIDEPTKRRLYGNEWVQGKDALFAEGVWEALADKQAARFSEGDSITAGVDASLNHDCTAVGHAKLLPDGRVAVGARIYAARRDAAAHVHFRTGRIEHKVVEQLLAGDLLHPDDPRREGEPEPYTEQYVLEGVGYDPRYFNRSAELLSEEGYTVVEYTPSAQALWDAVQDFYNAVHEGTVVHDGDPVLAAHVRAAAGQKTDRGWKVSKLKATRHIDGLMAVIMAHALARLLLRDPDAVMALGPGGEQLKVSEADIDAMLGLLSCFGCGEPVPANQVCPLCGHDNTLEGGDDDGAEAED